MTLLIPLLFACRPQDAPPDAPPAAACTESCTDDTAQQGSEAPTGDTGAATAHTGDSDPATPYDRDGDGVQSPANCDDDDPSVYPGADDVTGDAVDSNCDGTDGMAGAYAVGPWRHADFGHSIATGDWDDDGRDEIVVGAPALTNPTYDEWIEGGAIVLLGEDLDGAITLPGGPEATAAASRLLVVARCAAT